MVPLGPLGLRDSVRLFCRLAPGLRTARERADFQSFLAPSPGQHHLTAKSANLSRRSRALLRVRQHPYPNPSRDPSTGPGEQVNFV